MENQIPEQKQPTTAEIMAGLKEAIEMQKLQTELQELRTRVVVGRANEIHGIRQINMMMAEEQEAQKEQEHPNPTEPTAEPTAEPKERKLKKEKI